MHAFADIERYRSRYQKIDIVRNFTSDGTDISFLFDAYSSKFKRDPSFPRGYMVSLNGDLQFGTNIEEIYHEYFAHIPISMSGTIPSKVLILGAGDGLLLRELLKYPHIKDVTLVEIDNKMITLARTHPMLMHVNNNAFSDKRVNVIIADAYHFIKNDTHYYDAVYMDFPDTRDYNISKLYSREFYSFVKRRLRQNGFIAFDANGLEFMNEEGHQRTEALDSWEIYYNTLYAAGFRTIIPFISQLETDKPDALQLLSKDIAQWLTDEKFSQSALFVKNQEKTIAKRILLRFISQLKTSFIMATQKKLTGELSFKDYGVNLHVLNSKRFELALKVPYNITKVNRNKINSIMRPTLPNAPFWAIKLPY
jgi:spermidine synthase